MAKQGYGSRRAPRGPHKVGQSKKTKASKQEFGATRAPRGPQRAGESKKRGRIPGGGDTVYRPGKKGTRKQKVRLGNSTYKMGQ